MTENESLEMDTDPQNQPADHYLAALLAQSRALNTLMSHLYSSQTDSFSELVSGNQTMRVKGSADREKLQRKLANQLILFYLKIYQNIHKQMECWINTKESRGGQGYIFNKLPGEVW